MFLLSLPMRERGLKCSWSTLVESYFKSLPMRERGLKYPCAGHLPTPATVAPHAGAWIEMR